MKKNKQNNKLFWVFVITFLIVILIPFCFKDRTIFKIKEVSISCLSYNDLVNLTKQLTPNSPLYFRLQKQLNTPYIVNKFFSHPYLGRDKSRPYNFLRLAQWNIERGFNVNVIKNIFSNKYGYYYSYKNNIGADSQFKKELEALSRSDIISLNEVDVGMPRTGYKNIASEIADSLNYNYVFATEFIELNPIIDKQKFNSFRYLGLHGNAIISRYPIKSARVIRLPEYYRWFEEEIQKNLLLNMSEELAQRMFLAKKLQKAR